MKAYPKAYFGRTSKAVPTREGALARLSPYKMHLVRFIDSLPEGARLLDIGAGSGRTALLVRALRPDIVVEACDLADTAALMPEGVAFTQASVEEVGSAYAPGSFDAVLCQHVIEHLVSPMGLIESIHVVMKAGGQVFIETPNWTRLYIPFSHMFFWNDYTHVKPYPKFALVKLLLEHGFSIASIRTCSSTTWFARKKSKAPAAPSKEPKAEGRALVDAYRYNSKASRIFARLVNPLIRDIIIVIGRKS